MRNTTDLVLREVLLHSLLSFLVFRRYGGQQSRRTASPAPHRNVFIHILCGTVAKAVETRRGGVVTEIEGYY